MKVILLQDVPNIGRKFDEKNVSDGYALNFLIPKGLVEVATPKAAARAKTARTQADAERKVQEDLLLKNIKAVAEATVQLTEKANEKGHLFAAVHKPEIAKALKEQAKIDVPQDLIVLASPIKELGEHSIEVKVQDKSASFKLIVAAA